MDKNNYIIFCSPVDDSALITFSVGEAHVEEKGYITDKIAECLFIRTDFMDICEDETVEIAKKDIPQLIEFLQKQL